jgi:hypothetical protein
MGPRSRGSLNFENFRTPTWESWDKMPFGCGPRGEAQSIYNIRGKVMASPKSRSWWVLWIRIYPWFILAPKVLHLCINQLVGWFVQVCVSDWSLVILPSPIPELQHAPLPPKCCKSRSVHPTPWSSVVLTSYSHLSQSRSLGAHHYFMNLTPWHTQMVSIVNIGHDHMINEVHSHGWNDFISHSCITCG